MVTISKKQFTELAAVEGGFCVSMYLPVHRAGLEVINRKDALVFKNQLKSVSEELVRQGMPIANVGAFLEPAKKLYADPGFWRYQEEGLAVFLSKNFLQHFTLPFAPRSYVNVSKEFYLKPLMPIFYGDGHFYLLGLNLHQITFYKGDRQSLTKIDIQKVVPQKLEEVVGTDHKERAHQFHTQREGGHGKGAVFHGHGEWKGEFRKDEILRFFRAVDKSIVQQIDDLKAPLLVAGLDYLFSIYQEANTYPHLLGEHLSRNPAHISVKELHAQSWPKVYRHFDQSRLEKIRQYGDYLQTERTSSEIVEVIPAAVAGRIDTLFLDEMAEIWGTYDPESGKMKIHEEKRTINISLLDFLAKTVLLNKGTVYLQSRETLPEPLSPVNALYRY